MNRPDLIAELSRRFPWLDSDDEQANGGDVVDALQEWYQELLEVERARQKKHG